MRASKLELGGSWVWFSPGARKIFLSFLVFEFSFFNVINTSPYSGERDTFFCIPNSRFNFYSGDTLALKRYIYSWPQKGLISLIIHYNKNDNHILSSHLNQCTAFVGIKTQYCRVSKYHDFSYIMQLLEILTTADSMAELKKKAWLVFQPNLYSGDSWLSPEVVPE